MCVYVWLDLVVCIGRHGLYCIQTPVGTQVKLGHLRRVASVMYGAAWQTVVGWQQKMAWNHSGIVRKQCCCFLILAVPFLVRFPQKMAVSKLGQTHCRKLIAWGHFHCAMVIATPWREYTVCKVLEMICMGFAAKVGKIGLHKRYSFWKSGCWVRTVEVWAEKKQTADDVVVWSVYSV